MNDQKIIIVTSLDVSAWKSCQHITKNLISSYLKCFTEKNVEFLEIEENATQYTARKYANIIKKMNPDLIVWLDHKPCAAMMLMELDFCYKDVPFNLKPKFIIHLFGDFVLDCLDWEKTESAINSFPVHFAVASEKQKILLEKFFSGDKSICSVVPFPVNDEIYSMQNFATNRNEIRTRFNLSDELVIVYTGRISFQKNVDVLINTFNKIKNLIDHKIELWIVGPWDDILLPYFGLQGMPGSQFTQFRSVVDFKNISNVKFLGNLDEIDLKKIYHAADLFVSFSTFNDEDYGMSVAEALSSGLPCLLSDWGGFSSFAKYSDEVDLVNVLSTEKNMNIDSQMAQKKMLTKILKLLNKESSREKISIDISKILTIDSISLCINEMTNKPNKINNVKFSFIFHKLCGLFQFAPNGPFKNNYKFYNEIYGDYATG